ncbi:hypothetical protein, partial [Escherichia coli]|uniref:hypothetical protein n=1 Tax=Escherichia coli TaxID=562 RepID=UPI00397D1403
LLQLTVILSFDDNTVFIPGVKFPSCISDGVEIEHVISGISTSTVALYLCVVAVTAHTENSEKKAVIVLKINFVL